MIGSNIDKDNFILNAELLGYRVEDQKNLAESMKIAELFANVPFLDEFEIQFSIQSDFGDSFETMEVNSLELNYEILLESYLKDFDMKSVGLPSKQEVVDGIGEVVAGIGKPLEEVTLDEFSDYAIGFGCDYADTLNGMIEACVRLGGESLEKHKRGDYINDNSSITTQTVVMLTLPLLAEVLESLIASEQDLAIKLSKGLIAADGVKEKIDESVHSLIREAQISSIMKR